VVEYVNLNGKKTAVSDLPSNIQKQLQKQSHIESSQVNTQQTFVQQQKQFFEQDHIVRDQKGREVSVPGRFAEKAGIKAPDRKKIRDARRKKEKEEERREKEEEDRKLKVKVHGGKDKGVKEFRELSPKLQRDVLRSVHPISLAVDHGILAPSDSIHFMSREKAKATRTKSKKVSRAVHNPVLESSFKTFLTTGNTAALNSYLAEIQRTQGARAAFKEREMLINKGILHTSLEGARQSGGTGDRPIRVGKEAEARRSAQILKTGQKTLHQQMFGEPVVGTLGSTFDQRFPTVLVPAEGHPDFVGAPREGTAPPLTETKYQVGERTFDTQEEAQKYANLTAKTEVVPMFLLPHVPTGTEGGEKSQFKQDVESAYDFLDIKSEDPNIQRDTEGSAIAVEFGKAGLHLGGGILNLAERFDTSFGKGAKELKGFQGAYQPVQPISFSSSSADAIPTNVLIDKSSKGEVRSEIVSLNNTLTSTDSNHLSQVHQSI
jgi:hypothetical protein